MAMSVSAHGTSRGRARAYLLAHLLHVSGVVEGLDGDGQKDIEEHKGSHNDSEAEEDDGDPAHVKNAAVRLNAIVHDGVPILARQHLGWR